MKRKTSQSIGLILIIIGALALYNGIFLDNLLSFRNLWPLFIFLPGLYLEIDYYANRKYRDPGVLIPAAFLTFLGIYFFIKEFFYLNIDIGMPVFIFIIGIAMFQFYTAKPEDSGVLTVSIGLMLLGAIIGVTRVIPSIPYWLNPNTVKALVVIFLGIYLISKGTSKKKNEERKSKSRSTFKSSSTYRPSSRDENIKSDKES
ncbi:MAG: hypothetical protein GX752_00620 [Clostridium sp.]|nr:hypothetical protein [Clostridium sp.]